MDTLVSTPEPLLSDFMTGRSFKGFNQKPYYSTEGDFLTFFLEDKDHFAERVDDILTIYKSNAGAKVIGFKLKGITLLTSRAEESRLQVHDDGKLKVQMLLIAGQQEAIEGVDREALKVYRYFFGATFGITIPAPSTLEPPRPRPSVEAEVLPLGA